MIIKKIGLSICLLFISAALRAQVKPPPGTIQIDSLLFIDQNEMSNIGYLEFLHYIKKDSSESFYKTNLPDTTLIISEYVEMSDSLITNEIYLRYPKTRKYPLVGVTYDQAVNYCKWRTFAVRQFLQKKRELDSSYLFVYRLPTIEEWIKIAIGTDYEFKERSKYFKDLDHAHVERSTLRQIVKENRFSLSARKYESLLIEYLREHPVHFADNLAYKGDNLWLKKALNTNFPWPARSYDHTRPIIYDLRGNVSEMTATKGIAKGGNWQTAEGEITIFDNIKYTAPSETIGFRCICEVVPLNED